MEGMWQVKGRKVTGGVGWGRDRRGKDKAEKLQVSVG